jgi:CDP-diacylglycerol--serine O-phosphatidyltransferase
MESLKESNKSKEKRPRHRRIRAISIAPAMLTLGNLLSGFAAIHFATRPDIAIQGPMLEKFASTNLTLACYLIFLAMVCDALDGRMARFARATSDFGGQLDSLADMVSFGTAPAFIVIRLILNIFAPENAMGEIWVSPLAGTAFGRFCWIAAGAFVACAALRLARFNAENVPDESSHMAFKGLPAPGAAGTLISLVLLHESVFHHTALAKFSVPFAAVMPWVVIALGLLMVSRLPYVHIVNRFLRGKKPFWVLVAAVLCGLAFLLWPAAALAVSLCSYALTGPIGRLLSFRRRKEVLATNDTNGHE